MCIVHQSLCMKRDSSAHLYHRHHLVAAAQVLHMIETQHFCHGDAATVVIEGPVGAHLQILLPVKAIALVSDQDTLTELNRYNLPGSPTDLETTSLIIGSFVRKEII